MATTDPATGKHSGQRVSLLHANLDTELTDVTVSAKPAGKATRPTGEGEGERSTRGPTGSVLHTTAHHPFWDATTGRWVDAAKLIPGQSTLVGPDGQLRQVTAVRNFTGAKLMRDLTVATTHTYYVIAGDTPVLVHNTVPCGTGLKNSSDGLKGIFGDGGVRGKSITNIRSQLLDNGFSQGLTKNKKGYLFQNGTGEEVRIMRRGGGWDIRVRNANGNYLDEFGNVANPADTHGIQVYS